MAFTFLFYSIIICCILIVVEASILLANMPFVHDPHPSSALHSLTVCRNISYITVLMAVISLQWPRSQLITLAASIQLSASTCGTPP